MKILKINTTIVHLFLFLSTLIVVHGCGHSQGNVPDGSTVTINPSIVNLTNSYVVGDVIQNFEVVVKDFNLNPVPNATLTISGGFANPVSNTTGPDVSPRYQFYYYINGYNAPNVLENNGYTAQTNDSGVYEFSIVVYSSVTLTSGGPPIPNDFNDTIYVAAGTAVPAQATLNVTVSQ